MAAAKKPVTRPKRKCPKCLGTKFRAIDTTVNGIRFGVLVCDNPACQIVLGAGPITTS
jgi:hypothetical protein